MVVLGHVFIKVTNELDTTKQLSIFKEYLLPANILNGNSMSGDFELSPIAIHNESYIGFKPSSNINYYQLPANKKFSFRILNKNLNALACAGQDISRGCFEIPARSSPNYNFDSQSAYGTEFYRSFVLDKYLLSSLKMDYFIIHGPIEHSSGLDALDIIVSIQDENGLSKRRLGILSILLLLLYMMV